MLYKLISLYATFFWCHNVSDFQLNCGEKEEKTLQRMQTQTMTFLDTPGLPLAQTYRCSLNLSQSTWGESALGLIWFQSKTMCRQAFVWVPTSTARWDQQRRHTLTITIIPNHHGHDMLWVKTSCWVFKTMLCPKIKNRLPVACGFAAHSV